MGPRRELNETYFVHRSANRAAALNHIFGAVNCLF